LFRVFIHDQNPRGVHLHLEQIRAGLSARDGLLLDYLASRPGELVTFDELKAQVWQGEDPSKRAVEAAVHRVRLALAAVEVAQAAVQNERGRGYRFVVDG
jgi:DNA-binding response OmpR family regulator